MVNTAHEKHTKQSEAQKPAGGSYQTRAATPARETPKPQQS
jgi:hypothetical protein